MYAGNITLNKETSEISSPNATLFLNNKESEIMETLIKNKEKSVKTNELHKKISDKKEKNGEEVKIYILLLQEKLNVIGANVTIDGTEEYSLKSI